MENKYLRKLNLFVKFHFAYSDRNINIKKKKKKLT